MAGHANEVVIAAKIEKLERDLKRLQRQEYLTGKSNVIIGDSPTTDYQLNVYQDAGTAYVAAFIHDGDGDAYQGIYLRAGADSNPSVTFIQFDAGAGADVGSIEGDGAGGVSYTSASDIRAKHVVATIDGETALAAVARIDPIVYTHKDTPTGPRALGFSAQAIAEHYPEAVSVDVAGHYRLSYERLVPVLWAAVQELSRQVATLKAAQ